MNERVLNVAKDVEDVANKIRGVCEVLLECRKGLAAAANVLREPEVGEEKRFRYEARFFVSEPIDVYAKDRFDAFKKAKKEAALLANDDYIDHDVAIAPLANNDLIAGEWEYLDVEEELEDQEDNEE